MDCPSLPQTKPHTRKHLYSSHCWYGSLRVYERHFSLTPSCIPITRSRSRVTLCPQRSHQREWCYCCLFSVVPPYNIINIDAPSTSRSALWVGLAGCRVKVLWRKTKVLLVWLAWRVFKWWSVSLVFWGEVSHCTSSVFLSALTPTRLISVRRVIIWLYRFIFIEVLFVFCCIYILKSIYNLYEIWLSSILHKQSDKCLFYSHKLAIFGGFWLRPINIVTVMQWWWVPKFGTVLSYLYHIVSLL